jgi:hypothetical protein
MAQIHIIECEGKIAGRRAAWIAEREMDRAGFTHTVDDIQSGQIEHVKTVWCLDTETGRAEDVTEAVALEITARVVNGSDMPLGDVFDFVENQLGCAHMAELSREYA